MLHVTGAHPDHRLEVAITGLGAVSGYGEGAAALWSGIAEGRDALSPIQRFPCPPLASQLGGVLPLWPGELLETDDDRIYDLCVRVAACAAREALAAAGIGPELAAPERVALVVGTSAQRDHLGLDVQVARMARALGVRGPAVAVGTVCCASTGAVGLGRDLLEAGSADVVLAGGADALTVELVAGFHALGLLSRGRCAPFSELAGTTLGEGAGFVVLETAERARSRGATPVAWLRGYGLSADAYHETSPDPSGAGVARAIRAALGDAEVAPEQVGYVNAHGTGTGANDAAEWRGLQAALGRRAEEIPVSSTKGHLGHAQGAAGILELCATLLAMREGKVPPTLHFTRPRRGAPVDPVGEALPRTHPWDAAVSTNSAMAGANAAVVVTRHAPPPRARRARRPVAVAGVGAVRAGPEELRRMLERLAPTADTDGMDPSAQLLTAAAALALQDGGLRISTERRDRAGLVLGNGRLSPATVRDFRASIAQRGLWRLSTSAFARRMPSAPAGACAAALDLRGPTSTISTGAGEDLCAIAHAAQLLAGRDDADLIVAGGVRESAAPGVRHGHPASSRPDLQAHAVDETGRATAPAGRDAELILAGDVREETSELGEAAVLALLAGRSAVMLAGWGVAGAGEEAAALEQALALAGARPSEVAARYSGAFAPAVEMVRSGAARVAAVVTSGGCAACALVLCRCEWTRS